MGYAYKISDAGAVYFITCTVNKWVDVFTRKDYCDIIIDSLNFCVENKGLIIYGYVIMSNHLHLLVQAKEEGLSDVLRDFKKFTSGTIVRAIEINMQESRRDWMLWLFKETDAEGKVAYQFWKPDNNPELCYHLPFMWQKLNYIHYNPVRAGIVQKAEEYVYNSAADYVFGKQVRRVKVALLDVVQTTYC
ncbi:REP-associated tyrosine transposase [Aridibaculum aurantiacum]|uniref:REP-associated tyrosine transposase n=1 Tax=Aridibaculum aurantiacum TaxID=2810307 RepID=UPI001F6008F0|nr:transposase [Aridibaculum aurantiacum]